MEELKKKEQIKPLLTFLQQLSIALALYSIANDQEFETVSFSEKVAMGKNPQSDILVVK